MSEQTHPRQGEEAAAVIAPSGLLLSVEPLAAAGFSASAGDQTDTDADGQDTGDAAADSDGTDATGDADGADESDAESSDDMDADGSDASGDADSTDAR